MQSCSRLRRHCVQYAHARFLTPVVTVPGLQRWRMRRAYSQRDLAKAADLAPRTVTYAEQGYSVSLRTLRKLSKVLQVDPSELTAEQEN
jgi:DNA-binding XRE family transcriptional regulator